MDLPDGQSGLMRNIPAVRAAAILKWGRQLKIESNKSVHISNILGLGHRV